MSLICCWVSIGFIELCIRMPCRHERQRPCCSSCPCERIPLRSSQRPLLLSRRSRRPSCDRNEDSPLASSFEPELLRISRSIESRVRAARSESAVHRSNCRSYKGSFPDEFIGTGDSATLAEPNEVWSRVKRRIEILSCRAHIIGQNLTSRSVFFDDVKRVRFALRRDDIWILHRD